MTDQERTQKKNCAQDHKNVGGVEDVGGPDRQKHVVADVAQGKTIELIAQCSSQNQTPSRGIEPGPAVAVEHDGPVKARAQGNKPNDRQSRLEQWSAVAFQAEHAAVIPGLGSCIQARDKLPNCGRLSPSRKGPPLAQLVKEKTNTRGRQKHPDEGTMTSGVLVRRRQ
jgi:hypothetical protein